MLVKQIEGKHVVWFEQHNQWVQFEEPAWFVFQQWEKGRCREEIAEYCKKRYKCKDEECRKFVLEITDKVKFLQSPAQHPSGINPEDQVESHSLTNYFSIRHYTINNKAVTFCFESEWFENNIHPLIAHFEISENKIIDTRFELFRKEGRFGIRVTKGKSKTWFFDQPELQKGRVFIELLNAIYDKTEDEWMTIVHGSAVTDGIRTILFTSACGGGKSTIAALLQANGFQVIADDMIPVAAKNGRVYPFPASLSVKEGAIPILLPYYPELEKALTYAFPASGKRMRYLPINHSKPQIKTINKAKALIFINFDPSVIFRLEQLSKLEAIKLFNIEAWVSSTPQNARSFINWFIKLPCYRLTYSDNSKAIETIRHLFEDK